jgi:formamidopyrimidine-DNA glycosylase
MPELPEVETVRRGLNATTLDRQIIDSEVLLARTIAYPDLQNFIAGLKGTKFLNWRRQGKYLLGELSNQSILGVHLRMTGSLLWCNSDRPVHKHTRVRILLGNPSEDTYTELRFNDQRTFGQMWLVPSGIAAQAVITGLQKLGIEPFAPEFTPAHLQQRLAKSDRPIKNSLLDQTVVAGIGNIYADESLFLSNIHPQQPSNQLTETQGRSLHLAIIKALTDGIASGGTTFSDFQDVAGEKGNYINAAWVFRRTGQPCKICQTPIARIKLAGRSTHFCPQCQQLN